MRFVVDASASAGWFLPDEHSAAATALAHQMAAHGAVAPDLYWHEIVNLLISATRSGRLDEAALDEQLLNLADLPVQPRNISDRRQIARLALRHRLTGYDSVYLALALDGKLPLATFDKALRRASQAEGVIILPESV